jgi:hypothetical protein
MKSRLNAYTLDITIKALRYYTRKHKKNERAIWAQFFDLLCFDALIGGTDRHYNNWGILEKADSGKFLRISPAFDNGVSLMWKMKEYKPKFLEGAFDRSFIKKAESMFKKKQGGKYKLYELLIELYSIDEYKRSKIATNILNRISNVEISKIHAVLIQTVPRLKMFETKNGELDFICEYVKLRLEMLKNTLYILSKTRDV